MNDFRSLFRIIAALTFVAAPATIAGQVEPAGHESQKLRVFIDCETDGCDADYFRIQIPFVDHVRDRADASLHVLVTSQSTGSGGETYTINFIGLREAAGQGDTLVYVASPSTTTNERRSELTRVIKLGLVRYVARTPLAGQLDIRYAAPASGAARLQPANDPWNLWVFRTNANGNISGESSQRFLSLRGSASANRISEEWKFRVGVNGNYTESRFTFSDGSKFASFTHSYGASQTLVKSIGGHWAAGEKASVSSSTFLNQRLAARAASAIEFDVFPYAEATRRQLTIQYSAGVSAFRYQDTTIFDKIEEVRPDQTLVAALDVKEPWGSANFSIGGASFLDDFRKYRATLNNSLDVRVFKGFSVNVFAGASLLRDQLYIAKGSLSDEDILLRRRQLASTYSFFAGVGLSYTFGSIFNNVVNPRFDLAGGG